MSETTTTRRMVGVAEAAAYIGISTPTLRHWIKTGRLPAVRLGPKLLRVDLDDIDAMTRPVEPTNGQIA